VTKKFKNVVFLNFRTGGGQKQSRRITSSIPLMSLYSDSDRTPVWTSISEAQTGDH